MLYKLIAISITSLLITACAGDGTDQGTSTPTTEGETPTPELTANPSPENTSTPIAIPTESPTTPVITPTSVPSIAPTITPIVSPTIAPTTLPTASPTLAPTQIPSPVATVAPTPVPTAVPTSVPTTVPTTVPTIAPTPEPTDNPLEGLHPDIVKVLNIPDNEILRSPADNWGDSYSIGDQCYCNTTFDHNIGDILVDTDAGSMTVREACDTLGPGPGPSGRPVYNDVQCGNGPANDAGDEDYCPGRVDLGKTGCVQVGPTWKFPNTQTPPTPIFNQALNRDKWALSSSANGDDLNLAIDGDSNTRWATGKTQSDGDWLVVDFGEQLIFNRVILNSEESPNDHPINYGVFVSDDGVDWGAVIVSGEGEPTTQIDLPEITTRYLRIEQYGTSNQYWWSIYELNVYLSDGTEPTPTPTSAAFPEDPFGDNPESVLIENNIGWVEGPTWVPDESAFIYNLTDRETPDIHRMWRPGENNTSEYWRVSGSNHGAIWSEGLIFMTNREPGRIAYIDPSQNPLEEVVLREGLGRPNDLDRFSDGSLYFSDWPNGGMDGVYRLYMNGDIETVISSSEINQPNGIAFTADCSRLYVANNPDVVAYDVDEDGNLSNKRNHVSGVDGMNGIAVDIQGNLYTPGDRKVTVFNSSGKRVAIWEPPAGHRVVNMTFGGTDNRWLLVTSDRGVSAVRTLIPGAECNGLGTQRP